MQKKKIVRSQCSTQQLQQPTKINRKKQRQEKDKVLSTLQFNIVQIRMYFGTGSCASRYICIAYAFSIYVNV